MDRRLENYIKTYSSIPEELCDLTVKELENTKWNRHNFYNSIKDEYYSNPQEPEYSYDALSTTKNLMDIIWKQIEHYIIKDFNFPWWNSWQGFNIIKFNRYTKDSLMTEHCDHIHDMFDGTRKGIPILSVVGLLNSNFEGGEFVLLEDYKINLKKGDVIIFPSSFLYPHRVNEVTSGTRYSFASWVW